MGNPYTAVSVSGYNSSPPSNDGSQTSSNRVDWNTHLTKIGAPLKTAIEGVDTNLTTAFSRIFGAAVSVKSANYTVQASDQGSFIGVDTNAVEISLPQASNLGNNFPIGIVNLTHPESSPGYLTISCDGPTDEINGLGSSVTIMPGGFAILTSLSGSGWRGMIDYGIYRITKAADTSRDTTSTLADDGDIAGLLLPASRHFELEAFLSFTSASATPDAKAALQFSSAPTERDFLIVQHDGSSTSSISQSTLASALAIPISAGNKGVAHIKGRVFVGSAATLDLQWAQNTSDATATVLERGSYMTLKPIPQYV